jgi:hypothetical protein
MHQTWTAPLFEESNIGCEIGTYYEDEDDPSFSFTRKPSQRGRSAARGAESSRTSPGGKAAEAAKEPCE